MRRPNRISPVVMLAAWVVAIAGATPSPAEPVRLTMPRATLAEAVERVRQAFPEMMYVVAGGVVDQRDVDLEAPGRDELMEALVEQFGVRATVIGDLWIVEGTPPSPALVDQLASLIELLPSGDPVREMLADPLAYTVRRPAEILADIARPLERPEPPPGRFTARGVRVTAEHPLYNELRAALLRHWCYAIDRPDDPLRPVLAVGEREGQFVALGPGGGAVWRHTIGADPSAPEGRPDPATAELTTVSPRGDGWWALGHPLSVRDDVSCRGTLADCLATLASVADAAIAPGAVPTATPVAVETRGLRLGVTLYAVCAAVGAPVDLRSISESYVLGASVVENAYCAMAHPDLRLWELSAGWNGVEASLRKASDGDMARLRSAEGVPLGELPPAATHALRRAMSHSDIDTPWTLQEQVDAALARAAIEVLFCFSSERGDVVACIAVTQAAIASWDLGASFGAAGLSTPGRRPGGTMAGALALAPLPAARTMYPMRLARWTRSMAERYGGTMPLVDGWPMPSEGGEAGGNH